MQRISNLKWPTVFILLFLVLIIGCAQKNVYLPEPSELFEKVTLHLYFEDNKAEIHERDYPRLDIVIDLIRSYPDSAVIVEGHTDNSGDREKNHDLSHRRAEAVKGYMVTKGGFDAELIKTAGYGDERPMFSNETALGREQNRRVDILIISR